MAWELFVSTCTPRPGCHDVVATMLREDQIDLDGIERNLVKYWPHVVFEQDFENPETYDQLLSVIQKALDCTFPTVLIRQITDYINIRSPVSKGNREFDFRGNQLEECFCFKSNNAPFQHIEQSYSPGDILKNTPLLLKRIVNSMQKEKIFPICDIYFEHLIQPHSTDTFQHCVETSKRLHSVIVFLRSSFIPFLCDLTHETSTQDEKAIQLVEKFLKNTYAVPIFVSRNKFERWLKLDASYLVEVENVLHLLESTLMLIFFGMNGFYAWSSSSVF